MDLSAIMHLEEFISTNHLQLYSILTQVLVTGPKGPEIIWTTLSLYSKVFHLIINL